MAMKSNKPRGSTAYISSRVGAGEFAGAGELPQRGPGKAAARKISAAMPAPKSAGRKPQSRRS